jgi:hypothetical protein
MTRQDEQAIINSIKKLQSITNALWRKSLENKAWIDALSSTLVEVLRQNTGVPESQIMKILDGKQKIAFQALLEEIEESNPGLSARLDDRDAGDVLPES